MPLLVSFCSPRLYIHVCICMYVFMYLHVDPVSFLMSETHQDPLAILTRNPFDCRHGQHRVTDQVCRLASLPRILGRHQRLSPSFYRQGTCVHVRYRKGRIFRRGESDALSTILTRFRRKMAKRMPFSISFPGVDLNRHALQMALIGAKNAANLVTQHFIDTGKASALA